MPNAQSIGVGIGIVIGVGFSALILKKELARKMEELERQQKEHGRQLAAVYSVVKKLIDTPVLPQKPIGFRTRQEMPGKTIIPAPIAMLAINYC
jgi:hypothetical protein